jgi:mRNA interferase RelE/StbE
LIWKIEFESKAHKELLCLEKQMQKRIANFLEKRIINEKNPRLTGNALYGDLSGLWRYRVGDCRIICEIQDKNLLVLVLSVGRRKDIYNRNIVRRSNYEKVSP